MKFEPTPNPNAVKCLLDHPLTGDGSIQSYFNADEAQSDPLATRLFAIAGVTNLLITPDWITVSKTPDAAWPPIKRAVQSLLSAPTAP
jgi:Scaffold protein Nfu/NifU N terminal